MPVMPPTLRGFLLPFAALLVSACASLASLEPPEVRVSSLRVLESDPGTLEQRFEVGLRVLNPNNRDIAVDGVDFELDVNDRRLARGLSSEGFTLPALGETTTTVVVTTSLLDLLRQAYDLSQRGGQSLDYQLNGKLHLASGLVRTIPFDYAGKLGP
jgi:LEA14-like dessication related protein